MLRKVLIANRGEIARRIMRTARHMGIGTVAVYSDPDVASPHAAEADEAVHLPGATAAETYLDIDAIIAAATATGADAIHPGYGFLAENAAFARAVIDAGLTFVGPPPDAIAVMGSKLASKRLMDQVGVPTLPSVEIDDLSDSELRAAAADIGYPVLVKASAGGGGKGMRIVGDAGGLLEAVAGARREAAASFGDGTVFLEKYLPAPRHVEVQVFADTHGNHVHLFERECSIQRRHQKIIEEAPSPAVDSDLRKRMGAAAVAAAAAVDYVGAGTVEFLLDDEDFYFLEMNTRLQVEHPVTEAVTGHDLVRLQFLVADGHPLPDDARMSEHHGHAIEARLYAEDTAAGFLPQTGRVERFRFPSGVRVDSGVEDGSEITVHYDPMLAKVIAHAPTRTEAALGLAKALEQAEIHGVVTNRGLLVSILRHPEFLAGDTDTHFLERHDPATLDRPVPESVRARHALAAALALQAEHRKADRLLPAVPSGWRNNPSQRQVTSFRAGEAAVVVEYAFDRRGRLAAAVDGTDLAVEAPSIAADRVTLEVDGVARSYRTHHVGDRSYVDGPDGSSDFSIEPRFGVEHVEVAAGSLTSPMPGKVISVSVEPGSTVEKGDAVVVIEAMKMEHTLRAPFDGTVESVHVEVGDQVEADQMLAIIA